MKIYRLYYLEQEYIPSDYVDHDITLGYFANAKAMNKWIDEHEDDYENVVVADEKLCYDEDLQFEEIEVIE